MASRKPDGYAVFEGDVEAGRFRTKTQAKNTERALKAAARSSHIVGFRTRIVPLYRTNSGAFRRKNSAKRPKARKISKRISAALSRFLKKANPGAFKGATHVRIRKTKTGMSYSAVGKPRRRTVRRKRR